MKNRFNRFHLLALFCGAITLSSCDNDDEGKGTPEVPATYNFEGADYSTSTNRVNMAVELHSYLGSGTTVALDQNKVDNMFSNTNAPFGTAALNTSNVNIADKTADANFYKGLAAQHVTNSSARNIPAAPGTAGFIPRGTGKILVNGNGVEVNQVVAKGMMGSLAFKEAMALLASVPNKDNSTKTNGTTAMQRTWDEAFGYLGVPADYDTTKTYSGAGKLPLWGGYLAERGKKIQAGGILFKAFRTGRAAIDAKDNVVLDEQIKIIQETWEKLAAAAALHYVTDPQKSSSVSNLGSQFHALSEGAGFAHALKYRANGSKLTDANYQKLKSILETDFYVLVNEPGFTKLKEAESILKSTYGL